MADPTLRGLIADPTREQWTREMEEQQRNQGIIDQARSLGLHTLLGPIGSLGMAVTGPAVQATRSANRAAQSSLPGTEVPLPTPSGAGAGGAAPVPVDPFAGLTPADFAKTSSTSSRTIYDPEKMFDYQVEQGAGREKRRAAGMIEADLLQEKAKKEYAVEAKGQEELAKREAVIDQQIAAQEAERQAWQSKLTEAMQEAQGAEVNPDRWWQDRSGMQKLALTAAAMLGGFTEGFTFGRVKDKTLATINQYINRDVLAQEASLREKRGQRGEMRGLLGMIDQRIGNLEVSKRVASAMIKDQVATKLMQVGRQLGASDSAHAAGILKVAALAHKQAAGELREVLDMTKRNVSGTTTKDPGALKRLRAQAAAKGSGGSLPKGLTDAREAYDTLNGYYQVATKHRRSAGTLMAGITPEIIKKKVTGIPEADKIDQQRNTIAVTVAKSKGVGQMSNEEREIFANEMGTIYDQVPAFVRGIRSSFSRVRTKQEAMLETAKAEGNAAAAQVLRNSIAYGRALERRRIAEVVGGM